jgi:acetylornithine deacetylase/succinyl-diaminopimelate desuccinylase-like protein
VPSAAWRLVAALNSLKLPDGRVAIDGFYEAVRPLTGSEKDALAAMPDTSAALGEALGLESFLDGLEGYEWQARLYGAPTCNICGVETGYTGPGLKTVLPARARAKVDFRLVPDQRPQEVLAQLRTHLEKHGYADVAIQPIADHERPTRTSLEDPWVRMTASVAKVFYGKPPEIAINSPGTAPMDTIVDEVTGSLLFAPGGAGYEGSRIHAPDEHIRLSDLTGATKVTARLLMEFGRRSG